MAVKPVVRTLIRFLKGDDGPTAVEYAFILALILVVALTGITVFGEATGDSFQESNGAIDAAFGGGR